MVNKILFIFTRGPVAGFKILIENAKNISHAMDIVREHQPATVVKSDTENDQVLDVFDYNDFEVVHIRRTFDGNVPPLAQPEITVVKAP